MGVQLRVSNLGSSLTLWSSIHSFSSFSITILNVDIRSRVNATKLFYKQLLYSDHVRALAGSTNLLADFFI